jgi:hypothetical protein
MSNIHEALELQTVIEEVAERIKDYPQGRSYLSPDGQGYVLAFGGDRAQVMNDFITAVGQYLRKVQQKRSDKAAAKEEVLRAFEEWLSKQKL